MSIEQRIAENTAALIENTAVLREILAASGTAPAAATAVKKSRTKAEPLAVVPDPEPVIEETPEPKAPVIEETPEPEPEAPVIEKTPEPTTSVVPDLPIPELRKVMKEQIKERIFSDPAFDAQFKAARKKFGVEIIKDLADDQVAAFYAEVLA